jgi:transcriptional regulator with GAF, ATPase, and Fis domain
VSNVSRKATDVDLGFCLAAQRIRELSIETWGADRAVEIVGHSPGVTNALVAVEKVAPFNEPVLITGETGTGKEGLAQALYLIGNRRGFPMVFVNCPQYLEGNLTVSELFGHKRGSFTGATSDRKGCFETADGGVIFLDEIGDLHMSAQVMLLRALAQGEFQPLGSDVTKKVNVRVVAATNRPLTEIGTAFRNDLFFRLRYFLLKLPPLRERGDDWRLLIERTLQRLHAKYGVSKRFSPAALALLEPYPWPGNVRELVSLVTAGYALADGVLIEPHDIVSHLVGLDGRAGEGRVEDDLYRRIVVDGQSFWHAVYAPYMERTLNRNQVRAVIQRGLLEGGGSYRNLLDVFHLGSDDYQRFMDFLRHQQLKP